MPTKHELQTKVEEEVREFFSKGSMTRLYELIAYHYLFNGGTRIDQINHAIQQELAKITQ